jgi:glycosyltransferase involved in cell wall biosynthesis
LDACLNQTHQPDEIIVVNNKSTDRTVSIVEKYVARYKNVRLLHQLKVQSMSATRDMGLSAATGDILGRIDSDAIIERNWAKNVLEFYKRSPKLGGISGPVSYYDMPWVKQAAKLDNLARRINRLIMKDYPFLYGSNMALSHKAWATIKDKVCSDGFDKFHEDIDIALHLRLEGFEIGYCPKMLAFISARRIEDKVKAFRDYTKRFSRTYQAHNVHDVKLKFPELFLMTIYFPIHLLKKYYAVDVEKNLQILRNAELI